MRPEHYYEFGSFRLFPATRQLLREGAPVWLTAKVFDLLLILVENHSLLLERSQLMTALWPSAIVEESNLTQTIFMLRKTLGDNQQDDRFIATISGRGYRFIAPVRECGRKDERGQIASPRQALQRAHVFTSLAVLPLKYLGPSRNHSPLGTGIADSIIATLSNNRRLIVRPTTAVLKYGAAGQDPMQAGRDLQVDAVVDGTIQQLGEKIRVSVQLISVHDGMTLWAGRYDDALTDMFAVQDAIAGQIARELRLELIHSGPQRFHGNYTDDLEAWQLYIRSRYFQDKRNESGLRRSLAYAEQVIALAPQFAMGYVSLADSYCLLGEYLYLAPDEAFPEAKAAINQALSRDEQLAEAHATLGEIYQYYDLAWAEAETEYRTAIELNPNYAAAYHWYAWLLMNRGRFDEALDNLRVAQRIDPGSLAIKTALGLPHYFRGECEQAEKYYREALEMDPNFAAAHYYLGEALKQQGKYDEALLEFEHDAEEHAQQSLAQIAHTLAVAGRSSEARARLEELLTLSQQRYVSPYCPALVYLGLGDIETALEYFNQGLEGRATWTSFLGCDPLLAPLRGDVRFTALLRRAGLTDG